MTSLELYYKGNEMYRSGNLEEAKILFLESIKIDPHFKSFELLGTIYFKENNLSMAVVYLAAAVALNSQVKPKAILSMVFLKMKRYSDAHKFANEALLIDCGNRMAKSVLMEIEKSGEL